MIDVHDARRQPGLLDEVAEQQRRQRGPRRRQQHDRAAGGQGGAELEDREVERVVVAGDRRDHADRLVDDVALGRVRLVVAAEVDACGRPWPRPPPSAGAPATAIFTWRYSARETGVPTSLTIEGSSRSAAASRTSAKRWMCRARSSPESADHTGNAARAAIDRRVDLVGRRPADGRDDLLGGRVEHVPGARPRVASISPPMSRVRVAGTQSRRGCWAVVVVVMNPDLLAARAFRARWSAVSP